MDEYYKSSFENVKRIVTIHQVTLAVLLELLDRKEKEEQDFLEALIAGLEGVK
jgi:hypothetical protein